MEVASWDDCDNAELDLNMEYGALNLMNKFFFATMQYPYDMRSRIATMIAAPLDDNHFQTDYDFILMSIWRGTHENERRAGEHGVATCLVDEKMSTARPRDFGNKREGTVLPLPSSNTQSACFPAVQ